LNRQDAKIAKTQSNPNGESSGPSMTASKCSSVIGSA